MFDESVSKCIYPPKNWCTIYRQRPNRNCDMAHFLLRFLLLLKDLIIFEPPRGKTNHLHRRKQRRRSASQ